MRPVDLRGGPDYVTGMRPWLAVLVLLAGCGETDGQGSCPPGPRADYPPPPYGVRQGATLADLGFVGADGAVFALGDVYRDETRQLLLLTTAAGWCAGCREEQPTLQGYHEQYAARGLAIVVALFEDDLYEPADAALAAAWQAQYALDFSVVADPSFQLAAYYDQALTPMNMLVEVCTMEILRIATGADLTALAAIFEARL